MIPAGHNIVRPRSTTDRGRIDTGSARSISSCRTDRSGSTLLTLGSGLASPAPGTITRLLTPAQTELLTGDWQYTLDVTFSDGTVTRYYRGGAQQECGHGC